MTLLNIQDVADMLGVTVRTIVNWEQNGRIPAPFQVGKTKRWRPETIEQWIKDREHANVVARVAKVNVDDLIEKGVDHGLVELRQAVERVLDRTE